jgi:DNA-binding transcriptional LysR family regulator
MLSLVQAGVGFTLMPGRMKKVYENSVQLLKLAEPYQMQQLIAIVFARNREQIRACGRWPPKGGCMREVCSIVPAP